MTSPHKDSAEIDSISRRARLLEATKYITNVKEANSFLGSRGLQLIITPPSSGGQALYRAWTFNDKLCDSYDLQDCLVMGIMKATPELDNLAWFEANHDRKPNPEQSFVPSEQETAYAIAREKIACALTLLNDATALLAESQRLIEGKAP